MKSLKRTPFISFFVTAVVMTFLFFILGFFSFTGSSVSTGKNYQQYLPFIQSFLRVLKGEESLWYSFSIYAGSPTIYTYLYTAFSPFNLLYLIPGISMITMANIIIILKISLAAAAFSFFSEKCIKPQSPITLFFSLCWALSSWFQVSLNNYSWFDAMYILPLLMAFTTDTIALNEYEGEKDFAYRKKDRTTLLLFTLCLTYLFITNFYMGFIISVFILVVYLIRSIIYIANTKTLKRIPVMLIRILLPCLLALGCCGLFFIPAYLFIKEHGGAFDTSLPELTTTIPDIISALFINSTGNSFNQVPALYCGLPVLLLLPFYFTDRNISKDKKIGVSAVLIIYICAMISPHLNMVLQIIRPQGVNSTFDFAPCVVFILIIIAEQVLLTNENTRELPFKTFRIYIAILIISYAFTALLQSMTGLNAATENGLILNSAFLLLWLLWIHLYTGQRFSSKALLYISFTLLIAELSINSFSSISSFAGSGSDPSLRISSSEFDNRYNKLNAAISTVKAADPSLYRMKLNGGSNYNEASLLGVNTLSSYGISDDEKVRLTFSTLGIPNSSHRTFDTGTQKFTDMLFSVKYTLTPDENGDYILNENPEALPFAFMVSPSMSAYMPEDDPFETDIALLQRMTDEDYILYSDVPEDRIKNAAFSEEIISSGGLVAYKRVTNQVNNPFVTYYINDADDNTYAWFNAEDGYGPSPELIAGFSGLNIPHKLNHNAVSSGLSEFPYEILDNTVGEGNFRSWTIDFTGVSSEQLLNTICFKQADPKELTRAYSNLSSHPMTITSSAPGRIEGTVTQDDEHMILFTTIPYDKGWTAYVDENKAHVIVTMDGDFVGLVVATNGEHKIKFVYETPGKLKGTVTTIVSFLIWSVLLLSRPDEKAEAKKKLKKEQKEKAAKENNTANNSADNKKETK